MEPMSRRVVESRVGEVVNFFSAEVFGWLVCFFWGGLGKNISRFGKTYRC